MLAAAAPPVWFVDPRGERERGEQVDAAVQSWRTGRVSILREEMDAVTKAEAQRSAACSSSSSSSSTRGLSNLEHVIGRELEGLAKWSLTGERDAAAEKARRLVSQRRQRNPNPNPNARE